MFAFAVLRPPPPPPHLFLDQTEDQRAEKSFWSLPPPPPPHPLPPALSQSLDPALLGDRSNWPGVILFFHSR